MHYCPEVSRQEDGRCRQQFSVTTRFHSIANPPFCFFYCFIRHRPKVSVVSVDEHLVDGSRRNGISSRFSFLPKNSAASPTLPHTYENSFTLVSRHAFIFCFVCKCFFFFTISYLILFFHHTNKNGFIVIVLWPATVACYRRSHLPDRSHPWGRTLCDNNTYICIYYLLFLFPADRLPRPREIATNILPPSFNRSTIHVQTYTYMHGVIVAVRILQL